MTTQSSDGLGARRSKSRTVCFRVTEDDFAQLDALAHQTSCSRGKVLRRCLRGARLRSTAFKAAHRTGGTRFDTTSSTTQLSLYSEPDGLRRNLFHDTSCPATGPAVEIKIVGAPHYFLSTSTPALSA